MGMKKTKAERSLIAKKAWRTRRKKNEHAQSQEAGLKAWKETIRPSEHGYIDELVKTQGIKRNCIFHHEGIPDLMVITEGGKLRFYEIKPKKGPQKRRMLNPKQTRTIKTLLEHERVKEVSLVRFEKKGGKPVYDPPIRLSRSNIEQHSYR